MFPFLQLWRARCTGALFRARDDLLPNCGRQASRSMAPLTRDRRLQRGGMAGRSAVDAVVEAEIDRCRARAGDETVARVRAEIDIGDFDIGRNFVELRAFSAENPIRR